MKGFFRRAKFMEIVGFAKCGVTSFKFLLRKFLDVRLCLADLPLMLLLYVHFLPQPFIRKCLSS